MRLRGERGNRGEGAKQGGRGVAAPIRPFRSTRTDGRNDGGEPTDRQARRREKERRRNAAFFILAETRRAARGPDVGRERNAPPFEAISPILPPTRLRRTPTLRQRCADAPPVLTVASTLPLLTRRDVKTFSGRSKREIRRSSPFRPIFRARTGSLRPGPSRPNVGGARRFFRRFRRRRRPNFPNSRRF